MLSHLGKNISTCKNDLSSLKFSPLQLFVSVLKGGGEETKFGPD